MITAVESGGQYYIYLRGSNNTIINGNNYSGWTLTGSDIHCEGDIETLRGYDGNVPAMGARRSRRPRLPSHATIPCSRDVQV